MTDQLKRRLAIAAAVALGTAAVLYFASPSSNAVKSPASPTARAGEMPGDAAWVGALGRIEPKSEIIRLGGASDEGIAEILVSEGEAVRKGQILGHLRSYATNVAERDRAAARLAEAEELLTAVNNSGEASIRESELKLQTMQDVYPLRVRAQEARIKRLEAELANNQDILNSRRALLAQQTQSRRDYENQLTLVTQNQEELRSQRYELDRLNKEMQLETLSAEATLQRVRAELFKSRAALGIETIRQEVVVAMARAQASALIAPIDGRVLKITTRSGERVGSDPILTLGDTSEMHAVAEVYETDIGRVRLGQKAAVRSPALPETLEGEVVKIGHMIFKNDVLGIDPAARVDARVVEVRIRLDADAGIADLSNLQVNVVIRTSEAPPAAALK